MPAIQNGSDRTLDFTPVTDYDISQDEPNCHPGAYTAEISDIKIEKTKDTGHPQLRLDWRMVETSEDGDEHQRSIGAMVFQRVPFYPSGVKKGSFQKRAFRGLLTKLGVDQSVVPTNITSKEDFDELISTLKGQTTEVWVTHSGGQDGGRKFENVQFTDPNGGAPVEEEEPTPAPRGKAAPAKKTAGKSARR